jgi:hypothetical protein
MGGEKHMKGGNTEVLNEIREILKELVEGQNELLSVVIEMREEQKKLLDEMRINNGNN